MLNLQPRSPHPLNTLRIPDIHEGIMLNEQQIRSEPRLDGASIHQTKFLRGIDRCRAEDVEIGDPGLTHEFELGVQGGAEGNGGYEGTVTCVGAGQERNP